MVVPISYTAGNALKMCDTCRGLDIFTVLLARPFGNGGQHHNEPTSVRLVCKEHLSLAVAFMLTSKRDGQEVIVRLTE